MKKRFSIEFDIDTQAPGVTVAQYSSLRGRRRSSHVLIRRDIEELRLGDNDQVLLLHVLCHEIGHIVAHELKMPAAVESRPFFSRAAFPPDLMLKLEEEAWTVAESMLFNDRARFLQLRDRALNSYRLYKLMHDEGQQFSPPPSNPWSKEFTVGSFLQWIRFRLSNAW